MKAALVLGQGRVGRALAQRWGGLARALPVRGLNLGALDAVLDRVELVVYAGGPAGERACLADPAGALWAHARVPEQLAHWARAAPHRAVGLVSTLIAEEAGFYGALKALAGRLVRALAPGAVTVIRAGQLYGAGLPLAEAGGVVAHFARDALARRRLRVAGTGGQTVRLTPLEDLGKVCDLLHDDAPGARPESIELGSDLIAVQDLARAVARIANYFTTGPIVDVVLGYGAPAAGALYAPPLEGDWPVSPLAETLTAWLREAQAVRGGGGGAA